MRTTGPIHEIPFINHSFTWTLETDWFYWFNLKTFPAQSAAITSLITLWLCIQRVLSIVPSCPNLFSSIWPTGIHCVWPTASFVCKYDVSVWGTTIKKNRKLGNKMSLRYMFSKKKWIMQTRKWKRHKERVRTPECITHHWYMNM